MKHNFRQLCPLPNLACSARETFNLCPHEPEPMSSSLQEHPTKTEGSVDCSVNIIQYVCFLYSYVRLWFSHRNIRELFRSWWLLIWPCVWLLERIVEPRGEDVCGGDGEHHHRWRECRRRGGGMAVRGSVSAKSALHSCTLLLLTARRRVVINIQHHITLLAWSM